jgi:hypothetical protein
MRQIPLPIERETSIAKQSALEGFLPTPEMREIAEAHALLRSLA